MDGSGLGLGCGCTKGTPLRGRFRSVAWYAFFFGTQLSWSDETKSAGFGKIGLKDLSLRDDAVDRLMDLDFLLSVDDEA